jgi:hypothetical protein
MLFAAVALLVAPEEGTAGKDKGPKASFVKGTVEHGASADGPWKRLKKKRKVPVGNFVRTGESARAELKFADGSVVRLGPSSMLHVTASGFDGKSKTVAVNAEVVGGKVWANVSKLVGSDAKFQVKTQNAVAGVRGTVFRVNLDKDKATVVKVYNGAVAVSNSPFFANQTGTGDSVGPIDKNRKQIAPPFAQIDKKEWEQRVEKMMAVRISAKGVMAPAESFSMEEETKKEAEEAEWVNWNLSCDNGACDDF